MGIADWMRVLETVRGLAQMTGKLRQRIDPGTAVTSIQDGGGGTLETRLAGVVVAALKEAFDRDRVRLDFERTQIEAERRRAEEALAAELRRQSAERGLSQLRLVAIMAIAAWMLSAVLAAWMPGMHAGPSRALLATGWLLVFVTLGCAFAGWQQISAWTENTGSATPGPSSTAAASAPWLLVATLAAIGVSLLVGL